MTTFYNKLLTVMEESRMATDEAMANHTTFRVGGPAAYFLRPADERELSGLIRLCRDEGMPYFILGNGSNLLVGDGGFLGAVISMEGFSQCMANCHNHTVTAGAGATLAGVGYEALKASLAGFSYFAGIPGTVGGAVVMNAGAYGSQMEDVLESVRVMTEQGEILTLSLADLKLGYRTSCILANRFIVLEARFRLQPGDGEEIRTHMDELAEKRRSRQPLTYPSAGSTFKRPAGYFAGKLIEEAGLSGYRVGGAEISSKHCGFVINKDGATAADILRLCREVKERVFAVSGVVLEMEVKTLGSFEYIEKG